MIKDKTASSPGGPGNSAVQGSGDQRPFSEAFTRAKLGWLARNLNAHRESIFMIEQLQPSWLNSTRRKLAYTMTFNALLGAVIGAVVKLAWDASDSVDPLCDPALADCITPSWPSWIVLTALWTMGLALYDLLTPDRLRIRFGSSRILFWLRRSARVAVFFAIWAAIWWFLGRFLFSDIPAYWLRHPLEIGIVLALFYEARVSFESPEGRIRAVEALGWSWSGLLKGAIVGVIGGLLFWLGFRYLGAGAESPEAVARNLYLHLPVGTLIGAFFGVISRRMARAKARPNQGVHLSLRNALFAGAMATLFLGVPYSVNIRLLFGHVEPQILTTASGWVIFLCGVVAFLWFGGLDYLRHWVLRWFLRSDIPLDLVPLLDYATELHFLQKVGGGYRFLHGYLQDYFAALPETSNRSGEGDVPPRTEHPREL